MDMGVAGSGGLPEPEQSQEGAGAVKGRKNMLHMSASQWILWSQNRRSEAIATRRRMEREAEKASKMVSELKCPGCEVSISVPTSGSGAVKFSSPMIVHELTCTVVHPDVAL
jgi:hypothetical protein